MPLQVKAIYWQVARTLDLLTQCEEMHTLVTTLLMRWKFLMITGCKQAILV